LVPISGDGVNPPTQIYFPPAPGNPYSVFLGFESEAFYYFARCIFSTKYGKATATFGIEASFTNGVAEAGQEMVFARVRLKAPVRDAGTYTFTHPWGTEIISVTPADITSKKGISYTRDVGLVPRDFAQAANGPIQLFCKQTTPIVGTPPPGTAWIGDGATVGTITPGLTGIDYVKLTGPTGIDLDGKKNNFVQSNQFTISGRVLTQIPAALSVQRATCLDVVTPTGTQEYIDVFASSDPTATVTVSGTAVVGTPPLIGNGTGKYYGHVPGTGAHGAGPFPITLTATTLGLATTTITANVVDNITITQATYSPVPGALSVAAKSSDGAAILTLKNTWSASGDLAVANDGVTLTTVGAMTVPPPSVTVTSSMGGSDTAPVAILP